MNVYEEIFVAGIFLFKVNNGKLGQSVKSVQSLKKRCQNGAMDVIGVVLVSLFLTLNRSIDWFLYDNGLRHERVK